MPNIFNRDFQDFINCLNIYEVEYLLVGGYSVILYGYNRTTGYLDIWVNQTEDNYHQLVLAFSCFQMRVFEITLEIFLTNLTMLKLMFLHLDDPRLRLTS